MFLYSKERRERGHQIMKCKKRGKTLYPSKFWNQALGDMPLSTEGTLQKDFLIKQVALLQKLLHQEMSQFQ